MIQQATSSPNRFRKHRLLISLILAVLAVVLLELTCKLIIWGVGHSQRRWQYEQNRLISGYSVYRHTPRFDFGMSTIRKDDSDPPVVLDEYGFISDVPVVREKSDNVLRVFLMGGSTAISSGQTETHSPVYRYPWGIYTYEHSIAGYLKMALHRRYPDRQIEVVTAAAFGRKIHQSMIVYLETVSQFAPDVVVALEGMNDINSFVTGTPWQDAEQEIHKYISLWNKYKQPSLIQRTSTAYALEKGLKRIGLIRNGHGAVSDSVEAVEPEMDDYKRLRSRFVKSSGVFLRNARQFQAIVNSDGAEFILAIQPMLHRRGANKRLSSRESKFDLITSHLDSEIPALELVNRYFFDDYLVGKCKEQIKGPAAIVVDCNRELNQVGSDIEVFTDYCHLTFEGNRLVGEIICEAYVRLRN